MSARKQYLTMIKTMAENGWDTTELILWINDINRKPAINAFTEGPARQVAYAVEYALRLELETNVVPEPTPMPMERCPRCGHTQRAKAGTEWRFSAV